MEQSRRIRFLMLDGGGVLMNGIPIEMFRMLFNKLQQNQEMGEFEKQQQLDRLRTATSHPATRSAWAKLKTDPSFSEDMYWQQVREAVPLSESMEELKFAVRESMQVHADVLELVRRITQAPREDNERVVAGIVSNHCTEWFASYVEKGNVSSVVEPALMCVSQTLGVAKPDKGIFEKAMEKICTFRPGTEANEVVFVDDKLENVRAAQEFGWHAVQFNRDSETADHLANRLAPFGLTV
mmetsp:Transcript_20320/g.77813  ORF Transcript_20320/g.77813 Transcript_20320/m.77813 type:complete len:239 (-) Transcript_20320:67-783(-)